MQARERIPAVQRSFLEALRRVGSKDDKASLPMFTGKMNPEEVIDWLEDLENQFEFEDVPEN